MSATLNPMLRCAAAAAVLVLAAPAAHAGVFGGFSKDGKRYLREPDQICEPIRGEHGVPLCHRAKADEIARGGFRRGALQQGRTADFTARARGTVIEVFAGGDEPAARYDTSGAVSRIDRVYARGKDRLVAVEYRTRFGRRLVEQVVVFDLGKGDRGASGEVGAGGTGSVSVAGPAGGGAAKRPAAPKVDEEARAKALAKATRLLHRKRWRRAKKALRAVLEIAPGDPEALFHLAGCQAALGERKAAIETLARIAASDHPKAPVWMVEARTHRYFARLRTDPDWRKAVGLTPDPGRKRSAYERVVGLGGHWEQAAIPCEQPRVNLSLNRKKQTFALRIRSKCRGSGDTTRLSGDWHAEGTSRLHLTFPNAGAADEGLTCKIEVCRDDSGEDCIRCQPGPDLEFLLRVVRR